MSLARLEPLGLRALRQFRYRLEPGPLRAVTTLGAVTTRTAVTALRASTAFRARATTLAVTTRTVTTGAIRTITPVAAGTIRAVPLRQGLGDRLEGPISRKDLEERRLLA